MSHETLRRIFAPLISALEARLARRTVIAAGGIVATEVDGFILGVPAEEWRVAAHYVFRGPLEPGLLRAFQKTVRPGMTVVDAGANIGIYTLYAARLAGASGKVYSFEPAPRTFRILRDNVQVNGLLETGRIVLHPLALSERAGEAAFHVYPDDSGHNTFFPDGRPAEMLRVPTAALDEVLPAGTRVDVVKIDAEGAEPLILRGMRRVISENPGVCIFLEFAPCHLARAGVDPGGFLEEIGSMGFHVSRVEDATGELLAAPAEELVSVFSANLRLVL